MAKKEGLEDKIRRIVKEALAGKPDGEGRDGDHDRDPFSLEAPMPSVEREAYAPVLQGYAMRKQAGMSADLAEILSKLDRGIDPTPLDFNFPPKNSYFRRSDFKEKFVALVKQGALASSAYRQACVDFDLPPYEKPSLAARILAELPDKPYGAFALSSGEVRERFGGPALLGDGEPKKGEHPRGCHCEVCLRRVEDEDR